MSESIKPVPLFRLLILRERYARPEMLGFGIKTWDDSATMLRMEPKTCTVSSCWEWGGGAEEWLHA